MEEIRVIKDLYILIKWILPHLSKYPRNYRYTLGDRIENRLYDILELLIKARYAKSKKRYYLNEANTILDMIRYFVRLSHDLKLLSNKQYKAVSEMLNEIGNQIGGWKKEREKNA